MSRPKITSIKELVRTAQAPTTQEDLSNLSFEELLALAIHYTGITKATFGMAGKKTDTVLALLKKYPLTGVARPIPIVSLVIKVNTMAKNRPAHALDVAPKVSGSSFVTYTNSTYDTAAMYGSRREAWQIIDAEEKGTIASTDTFEIQPTVSCQYGVYSKNQEPEHMRRQRVAAVVNSLVRPGKENEGFQSAVTVMPETYAAETVSAASSTVGALLETMKVPTTEHSLYDEMMGSETVHTFFAKNAAAGLTSTVYESAVDTPADDPSQAVIADVCTPPTYMAHVDPLATIVDLAPTLQPSRVGRSTIHMMDGLPVNADMRRRMNEIGDIHVPKGVKYIYLHTKNANIAKTLLRRHPKDLLVVYYNAPSWISNEDSEKDYVTRKDPKNPESEATIIKRGAIPWYGKFEPPAKEGSMYVQLKTSTATGVTAKKIEAGTKQVNRQETEKFKAIPDVQYFLVATHVYALNPSLFVESATDLPAYGKYFYVSRRFHSCNVLNANFEMATVDSFDRKEILNVFVHLMRMALAYPMTRASCAQVEIAGEVKRLIPYVGYYPFSARAEIREIAEAEKLKRVVPRANPYAYGQAPATEPSSSSPTPEKYEIVVVPAKPKVRARKVVVPPMFGKKAAEVTIQPEPAPPEPEPEMSGLQETEADVDW